MNSRDTNYLLRTVLRARSRQPIFSPTVEQPLAYQEANDALRQVFNGSSVNTRRDSLRVQVDSAAGAPSVSEETDSLSLNQLLRHLVVGSTAEEAN